MIEVGDGPLPMGSTTPVVVLGSLELIDEGETDHKIIALRASDPRASSVRSLDDLERSSPGLTARLVDWLKMYKTSDGKGINQLANNERPTSASEAKAIIAECEQRAGGALLAAPNARPEFAAAALGLGGPGYPAYGAMSPKSRVAKVRVWVAVPCRGGGVYARLAPTPPPRLAYAAATTQRDNPANTARFKCGSSAKSSRSARRRSHDDRQAPHDVERIMLPAPICSPAPGPSGPRRPCCRRCRASRAGRWPSRRSASASSSRG